MNDEISKWHDDLMMMYVNTDSPEHKSYWRRKKIQLWAKQTARRATLGTIIFFLGCLLMTAGIFLVAFCLALICMNFGVGWILQPSWPPTMPGYLAIASTLLVLALRGFVEHVFDKKIAPHLRRLLRIEIKEV